MIAPMLDWAALTGLAVAAWLVTYAIHSTLLLGAVWLLARGSARGAASRDLLWKMALIGGVVTASAQALVGAEPVVGRWALVGSSAGALVTPPITAVSGGAVTTRVGELPAEAGPVHRGGAAKSTGYGRGSDFVAVDSGGDVPRWGFGLAIVWLVGAGLGGVRLLRVHRAALRAIGPRREVGEGSVREMVGPLCRAAMLGAPVRLTVARGCASPAALLGREICFPARFVGELSREEQRSAIAHEIAHLARRDPQWALFAATLRTVFWFQPLNRAAEREIRDAAELLADQGAARLGASPIALARCLVRVGEWLTEGESAVPVGAAPAVRAASPLGARVERLLDDAGSRASGPSPACRLGVVCVLLVTACGAPRVAAWTAPAPTSPGGSSSRAIAATRLVSAAARPPSGDAGAAELRTGSVLPRGEGAPAAPQHPGRSEAESDLHPAPPAEPVAGPLASALSDGGAGPAATTPADQAEHGTFVLTYFGNTVATERFSRTGSELRGEFGNHKGQSFSYIATLGADASVVRLEGVDHTRPEAPSKRVVYTFRGDSVLAELTSGEHSWQKRRAAPSASMPYINASVAMMEQLVRRAIAQGGKPVELPLLVSGNGDRIGRAQVSFPSAGHVRLLLDDRGDRTADVHLEVNEAGRILRGSVPSQGIRIERQAGSAP